MVSPVLTREAIREVDDRKIEPVEVPEWGGSLFVRGLTGTDRDSFEMAMIVQRNAGKGKVNKDRRPAQELNLQNLRAKLVVRCVVDSDDIEKAKPVFELADIEWLGRKSAAALQRVYVVAQRLSGLAPEDVEDLTEDLGEEESDGSGSSLQDTSDTRPSLLPSDTSAATSSQSGWPSTGSSPSEDGDSTSS